jgi:hypothetical protein
MALKVVPAGDELCDIHNGRNPPQYVCKSCLKEFGVDPDRAAPARRRSLRSRIRRGRRRLRRAFASVNGRILIGGGIALVSVTALIVALATSGGGGEDTGGKVTHPRTQDGVVSALGLIPSPGNSGWITPDGACWVVSIQFDENVHPGKIAGNQLIEATNENLTVGAAVAQNDFSITTQQCASRIGAALRQNF